MGLLGFSTGTILGFELALLAIALGGLWWLRSKGAFGGARRAIRLTHQHSLFEVEVGARRFLVGTGPTGAPRVLLELTAEPVEPGAETSSIRSFKPSVLGGGG